MILLYEVPQDEKGTVVREFFARENIAYAEISVAQAGQTFGALFDGDFSEKENSLPGVPEEPAILFDANEYEPQAAAELLGTLEQAGVYFNYQVLVDEATRPASLGDVLIGHRDYQTFLAKLGFLQQMIDGCGALKEENYDPDRWSNIKIAIANANDYLDAVVSDTDSVFDQISPEDIDKHIANLQLAMKELLN